MRYSCPLLVKIIMSDMKMMGQTFNLAHDTQTAGEEKFTSVAGVTEEHVKNVQVTGK